MTKADREIVFNKFGGKCAYCGCELNVKFQVDHIVPKSFFEAHIKNQFRVPAFLKHLTIEDVNNIDNLMPTCGICNKWKSAHDLELFRSEIAEQIKRLNDWSSNFRFAKRYGLVKETPKPVIFYFELFNNQTQANE